jgi:MoCo/4Fe-4S cofactor protein with predicted Tat translocation signal
MEDQATKKNGMNNDTKEKGEVCPSKRGKLELSDIQAQLSDARGPKYWRSLEELANAPEFEEMLHREFPRHASEWDSKASRRDFMKLMGASMALAGLSACTKQPREAIVPYVRQPEEITLGKPLFYATAFTMGGYAVPVLVESHEGRPTKVEGNPQHPATLGGTDVFTQASVLTLYDPDRSQTVTFQGETRTYGAFLGALRPQLSAQKGVQGAGLRVLSGAINSPTLAAQMAAFQKLYPQAKWYQWEPVNRDNVRAGAQAALGQPVETQYAFDKADIILSLDGDFLTAGFPGFHRYARQFASRRNPELKEQMSRFYMVESTPTNTGGKADHRIALRASEVEQFARAVAQQLGAGGGGQVKPEHQKFLNALIKELQAHRGRALVVVGDHQPATVHALAHAINSALGAVGNTVMYSDPVPQMNAGANDSLRQLAGELNTGKIDLLIMLGVNPVYDAPADLGFLDALKKVAFRVHYGLYQDETSDWCHWHVNATHYMEMWSDARAFDGTASIVQPLIAPLYGGKSVHEIVELLNEKPQANGFEVVRAYWQGQMGGGNFDASWRRALHDGFIAGTTFTPRTMSASGGASAQASNSDASAMEIIFRRDPTIYDGSFANNGWLQETPKPMTQITWDNPVLISVATAKKLGLKSEDVVEIEFQGRKQTGAIWMQPGHPDNSITVFLGYGRKRVGRVGNGTGFNAYELRTSNMQWFGSGVKLTKTGENYGFGCTQGHQNMEGRPIARAATLEDFVRNPMFAHEMEHAPPVDLTLYREYEYKEHAWGMAIDLNACIGCKSCTVACQSENNIAVVGKMEVKRGRHMNWLRVDTYFEGAPENPKSHFQPVPCMQCENAPCEVVCPVAATVHSSEGLNDMVYNRCVGTRYCSNNCPYKVRRFNFALYQDWNTPQLKMMRNPQVTVRSRGVMEKCNYCVQRITEGRIRAEKEERRVADGEVLTACQQACPAGAIVFGDINDPNSRVAKAKANPRNYGVLEDLNTRPRTTYLAAVMNPNPELAEATEQHHGTEHS